MNRSKIIVFLLVTLAVGFWIASFVFKGNAPQSKATGNTMTLSFTPATPTAAANADFTVSLSAKPSVATILRGYKTKVTFDKAVLALKSIEYKTGEVSAGLGNSTTDIAKINTDGFFELVGEDTTKIGKPMTTETGAELASLTFTALTATATSATTSESLFYTHGIAGTSSDGFLVEWSAANGTITETKLDVNGGTTGGTCTSFSDDFSGTALNADNWATWTERSPNSTITVANGQVTENLLTSTSDTSIDIDSKKQLSGDFTAEVTSISTIASSQGGQSFLLFSNNHISFVISRHEAGSLITAVQSVADSTDYQSQDLALTLPAASPIKLKLERIGSTINMYYDLMAGAGYQLARTFNNFYTGEGRAIVGVQNWGTTFPQVTGIFDNFSQTCASGGTTGNVNLKIKAKFQGIIKQPAAAQNSMNVKVKVYSEGVATPYEGNGDFTADDKGIWSGTIGVNIPSITGKYKIMLKGPQHLQKKVCESTPTETSPGVYRCATGDITLVAGDNNLDFSGILFLVGDLDQNGIVDSVDFGLVKNCLGKSDAACLASSDLNRDGRVDTQDFSLIIFALGVRTDEL